MELHDLGFSVRSQTGGPTNVNEFIGAVEQLTYTQTFLVTCIGVTERVTVEAETLKVDGTIDNFIGLPEATFSIESTD